MGILIVSSEPIELLKDYEIKTGEESTEKIAHVYGPARRQPYVPTVTAQRQPIAPRRYEPSEPVYRHGKRCFLRMVPNQEKED